MQNPAPKQAASAPLGERARKAADRKRPEWQCQLLAMARELGNESSSSASEGRHQEEARSRAVDTAMAEAEDATLASVSTTWSELQTWRRLEGVHLAAMSAASWESFIHWSAALQRARTAMAWVSRHLKLELPLSRVTMAGKRRPNAVGEGASQAHVASPAMVQMLDTMLSATLLDPEPRSPDGLAQALLATWLQTFGVLRMSHVGRSTYLGVCGDVLTFKCSKGKQSFLRQGYIWHAPRTTFAGIDVTGMFKEGTQQGLGRFGSGDKMAITAITQHVREALRPLIDGVDKLTSYSWRRVAPTYAHIKAFSPSESSALGGWKDVHRPGPSQIAIR
jgi:hypothetical protein